MYLRAAYAELDHAVIQSFIKQNPLGILITAFESAKYPTIQCTHIPWVLDTEDDSISPPRPAKLRGHLAKANPQSQALMDLVKSRGSPFLEHEVTVLFNGPVEHYVTPKFYTETKPATGKVVPTWNYSAAQVYGKAQIFCDFKSEKTMSYLQQQLTDLTNQSEQTIMREAQMDDGKGWEVEDAPSSFIELLKKSIIGIEIDIHRMEGKYKMSQERGPGDWAGVMEGFQNLGTEKGRQMADAIASRGTKSDQ